MADQSRSGAQDEGELGAGGGGTGEERDAQTAAGVPLSHNPQNDLLPRGKRPACRWAEVGSDRYPDLAAAQAAALPVVAQALLEAIRSRLEDGRLCIQEEDGQRVVRFRGSDQP